MKTSSEGLALIKRWEADPEHVKAGRFPSYRDVGGVWTIGYGHTGPDVRQGMAIDETEAAALLIKDIATAEKAVNAAVAVPLAQHQFDALVSFTFNVGVGAFKGSTLLKKLNKGDYEAVPAQLARWNRATVNGKKTVVPGLVNRRAAEAGLWAKGSFVSGGAVAVGESDGKPALQSAGATGGMLAAASGVIAFLIQARELFTGHEDLWGYVLVGLIAAGAGAGLLALYGRLKVMKEHGV